MWEQGVLLMVTVNGARGDDVVLVLVHQSQLGVVAHCWRVERNYRSEERKAIITAIEDINATD